MPRLLFQAKKCSQVHEADNWGINGRVFAMKGLLPV
jgi:hypothetical protein